MEAMPAMAAVDEPPALRTRKGERGHSHVSLALAVARTAFIMFFTSSEALGQRMREKIDAAYP